MSTAARSTTNSATATGSFEIYLAALANSVTNSSNLTNLHLLPHKVTWKQVAGSNPAGGLGFFALMCQTCAIGSKHWATARELEAVPPVKRPLSPVELSSLPSGRGLRTILLGESLEAAFIDRSQPS